MSPDGTISEEPPEGVDQTKAGPEAQSRRNPQRPGGRERPESPASKEPPADADRTKMNPDGTNAEGPPKGVGTKANPGWLEVDR
jgi:hypothetical protein